jgi:hypothetical protein
MSVTSPRFIYSLLALNLLMRPFAAKAETPPPSPALTPIVLSSAQWQVQISPLTGGVTEIRDPRDGEKMNWVHDKRPWGIVRCELGGKTVAFDHPVSVSEPTPQSFGSTYEAAGLKLAVYRSIDPLGHFSETYALTNTSGGTLSLPEGALSITVPFNDSYSDGAPKCLTHNCNAHLWAGGNSSWVNAVRMGGTGPHLGLVLTHGGIASYKILEGASSNDRGNLAFNSSAIALPPGQTHTLSWTLFWHNDWKDFWTFLREQPQFVRLQAAHYTVVQGQTLEITAESASSLDKAKLSLNGKAIPTQHSNHQLTASLKTGDPGEYAFDLENNGQHTWLKANVIVDPMALIQARAKFIVEKQQKNAPGDPIDGAYLPYDNETNSPSYDKRPDHNEGRERMAMGVLVALYIPFCQDSALRQELMASLEKYEAFLQRELMDRSGIVFNEAYNKVYAEGRPRGGNTSRHGYNYPWMAHMHLAAYRATQDKKYLDLFVKVCQGLYIQKNGASYYEIGMPMLDALHTFAQAGMKAEYDEVLKYFTLHADAIAKKGGNYPKSEVNYEQSIVGPGVQIELEMFLATKNPAYLESAKKQMLYLEAFNGQQPDYHLNEIAIRHWDDYWFGKLRLYGDTLPHYWSTITAVAFDEYADATGDPSYSTRARDILLNNMCLFTPDGRGSCAYVYPKSLDGHPGNRPDPLANDQDWALVNWLTIYNRHQVNPHQTP